MTMEGSLLCDMNRHVKCAVRLNCVNNIIFYTPHNAFNVLPVCDPLGKELQNGPFNYNPDYSEIFIKHYHYKTIEEFVTNKMTKGFSDGSFNESNKFQDFFDKNDLTVEKAKWMIDYIFKLQNGLIPTNVSRNKVSLSNSSKMKLFIRLYYKFEAIYTCADYIGREDDALIKNQFNIIVNNVLDEIMPIIRSFSNLFDKIEPELVSLKNNVIPYINSKSDNISTVKNDILSWSYKWRSLIKLAENLYGAENVPDEDIKNHDNMLTRFKVDLYTVCWNEIDLLPFTIDYWKRFVNHAYVFDNGSNDGTIEYLKQFKWITVIPFETDGINDEVMLSIKNEMWKYSKGSADYVVVCDIDECLYAKDLEAELVYMNHAKQSVCHPRWYNMIGTELYEHQEGKYLHEIMRNSYEGNIYDKALLFNPNYITDINYEPGCHVCKPSPQDYDVYNGNRIFCFHYSRAFGVDYAIRKTHINGKRLSETNRIKGYGIHYTYSDERVRESYERNLQTSFDVNPIIDEE